MVVISAVSASSSRKQKEGKKRMRQVGNVEVPQSAFMAVLKLD
jgi:translation elongation factor EF-4